MPAAPHRPISGRTTKGKDIVFDGIENSDYLLGKGPSKRDHFFYINDLAFGGLRVTNFKVLFTAKDTWLGPELNLDFPAIYNLYWDPGENYDVMFRGAAPTRGDLRTSPGRYSGEDHGWAVSLFQPYMEQFFGELAMYPNRPTIPSAGSMNQLVREVNNPPGMQRLLKTLEPAIQKKK